MGTPRHLRGSEPVLMGKQGWKAQGLRMPVAAFTGQLTPQPLSPRAVSVSPADSIYTLSRRNHKSLRQSKTGAPDSQRCLFNSREKGGSSVVLSDQESLKSGHNDQRFLLAFLP